MEWWMWVVGGVVVLAAEVLTPGSFFLFFFGIGGIVTGGALACHWVEPGAPAWILWSIVSFASLLAFRPILVKYIRRSGPAGVHAYIGEPAFPLTDLAPGAIGQAELRGVPWTAENIGDTVLAKGQRCRVESLEGLKVKLRAQ